MNRKRIFLLLVSIAIAAAACGCATLPMGPRPEIRGVDASISGIDIDGVNMVFDIAVYNPYPISVRAQRFKYGLEIGGADFMNSSRTTGIDLPVGKTTTIALPIRISYFDLVRKYPALRDSSESKYRLHAAVGFSALGGSFELPFSHEGAFPIFRPPVVTVAKVRLVDISLEKAKIVVDSEIENPNVFAMDIGGLRYELDLGDVRLAVTDESGSARIGAGRQVALALSGEVLASSGLIKLLMNGVTEIPRVGISGSVRTEHGVIRMQR